MTTPTLDNVRIVVIPHSHLKDSNEISAGDGYLRRTLAVGVPDDVALLFARAHITQTQHTQLVSLLRDIAGAHDVPNHWRGAAAGLLVRLLGDERVACPVHGQHHPCAACADEYRSEASELACLRHPEKLIPCELCIAEAQVPKAAPTVPLPGFVDELAAEMSARAAGWRPVTELPPIAPNDQEDDARCVVVWIDAENPVDLSCELSTVALVRRGQYNDDDRRLRGAWWRPVMDAPPAVEWAAQDWKPIWKSTGVEPRTDDES